jgi:hypothetical protein
VLTVSWGGIAAQILQAVIGVRSKYRLGLTPGSTPLRSVLATIGAITDPPVPAEAIE